MTVVQAMRPDGLALSAISWGEVMEGILYSRRRALDLTQWRAFTSGITMLDVTLDIADLWADLRGYLRSRQKLIPDNDLIIAATAIYTGLKLVSRNERHFARVPGLDLIIPPA